MKLFKSAVFPSILAIFMVMALAPRVQADEVLWKSGKNLYIKLTEQDETASGEQPPPNDHPVDLDAGKISNALNLMQIYNENYIRTNEIKRVFSISQARLLGEQIAKGLRQAKPDQDIVFALAKSERGFLSIETTEFLAGRAFYVNGKLNVIIGDYAKPADRFKERMYQSHGAGDEIQYYFTHGKRSKSVGFDENVIAKDGIRHHQGRNDWFMIDVDLASRTYLAEQRERESEENKTVESEAMQREAARLARERREMRLELARMRKELEEAKQGGGSASVEERLKKLKELKDKDLISEEEYSRKRREILDDL